MSAIDQDRSVRPAGKRRITGPRTSRDARPARQVHAARKARQPAIAFRLTREAREIVALARKSHAEERAIGDGMQAYQMRAQLNQRLSAMANRMSARRLASPDDLLTLALAGWFATGARLALVKAILRASGMSPSQLGVPGKSRW